MTNSASHTYSLLRVKEKERRSSIVSRSTERKNYTVIYERESRTTLCRLPKPGPNAEYQCRALLLSMRVGKADGSGQPPVSCPSPPESNTKKTTRQIRSRHSLCLRISGCPMAMVLEYLSRRYWVNGDTWTHRESRS